MVVCLPGAKIEVITERVENIMGSGKGGSVLVHVGTNNVDREGTTAIVRISQWLPCPLAICTFGLDGKPC